MRLSKAGYRCLEVLSVVSAYRSRRARSKVDDDATLGSRDGDERKLRRSGRYTPWLCDSAGYE